jgi:hypothetical protein
MKVINWFLLFQVFSIQIAHSQETNLTMTIFPEYSWTIDKMIFHCTVENISSKTFKVIPFSRDCNDIYFPNFWKIFIQKDSIEYDVSSIVLLGEPPYSKLAKIRPHSKYDFSFCINFLKLGIVDYPKQEDFQLNNPLNNSKENINSNYGTYLIQLEYLSNLKIKKQAGFLISNKVNVLYKK